MRNPVIDLAMNGPTDIPDWFWYESGLSGDFVFDNVPDGDDLKTMWSKSPARYMKQVSVAVASVAPLLHLLRRRCRCAVIESVTPLCRWKPA